MIFDDRRDAGRRLGERLAHYEGRSDVIVLALPRGGVPVGFEVAQSIDAPLDVFLVRKLGLPGHEEYAMGAIASGGIRVVDEALLRSAGVPASVVARVVEKEERELNRRERLYRGELTAVGVAGRTAILVDDGLATGSSMRAAVEAVRERGAMRIVVAVPVGPRETAQNISRVADEVVCLSMPEPFVAVGRFYWNFDQTTDEEVIDLLSRARSDLGRSAALAR